MMAPLDDNFQDWKFVLDQSNQSTSKCQHQLYLHFIQVVCQFEFQIFNIGLQVFCIVTVVFMAFKLIFLIQSNSSN